MHVSDYDLLFMILMIDLVHYFALKSDNTHIFLV